MNYEHESVRREGSCGSL